MKSVFSSGFLKFQKGVGKLNIFFSHLIVIIIILFAVFPFYWTIVCTLKGQKQLYTRTPNLFPWPLTFDRFLIVLKNPRFILPFRNSFLIAIIASILVVLIASFGAYSLARYKYKGKTFIVFFLIFTYLLPPVLMIIPIFIIFSKLQLVNTYMGVVCGYITMCTSFSVLLLRNFFFDFPEELEEAALIDGCTRIKAFLKVVFPLTLPGIVAVTLFIFVQVWNDLLYAMILTKDIEHMTAAVQINLLVNSQFATMHYGQILTEGCLLTIPIVIMFVFLQKYLVKGMTAGAVKG